MPQAVGIAVAQFLFAAGAPLGIVNFFAIGAGGTLLLTGATLAANILLSSTQKQARGPAADTSVKGSVRLSTPTQRIIYGRQRVGGAVFFIEQKPPYLYLGLVLCARKITAVNGLYIGNTYVPLDANGEATSPPYYTGGTKYLKASFRLGEDDQNVDPLLAADFANLDPNFRQRGHATAVFRFHYGDSIEHHQTLWGNVLVPNVSLDVSGVAVYDPRNPTHDIDDETTWTFNNNGVLIGADFLKAQYGGRIAADRIDWDRIADAADYCDDLVATKYEGFQKRWTIDGVISLDQRPFDIFNAMLGAFRGRCVQHQGLTWIESSRAKSPSFSITENNLAGGFTYRDARPKKEALNTVRTRFVAPDREYEVVDGPVLVDEDYLDADGEPLEATADLGLTSTHQRAQRLGLALLEESRLGKTFAASVRFDRLSARVKAGDIVTVALRTFASPNGIYIVTRCGFAEDFASLALELSEYDGGIDGRILPADEREFDLASIDVS